jgi:hypothetical protein
MGIGELWAFFRAFPQAVKLLSQISDDLKQLRQDRIDTAIAEINKKVDETLHNILNASSDTERRKLALEYAQRTSI